MARSWPHEVDIRTSVWTLPVDAESVLYARRLMPLTTPASSTHRDNHPGRRVVSLSIRLRPASRAICRITGPVRASPCGNVCLSSDGLFVLEVVRGEVGTTPGISSFDLKTGESWGGIQTVGVQWTFRAAANGCCLQPRDPPRHRGLDTRTAEHRAVYAHPTAICIWPVSPETRWGSSISEEAGRQPRMWAAPSAGCKTFRAEWVDLGRAIKYPAGARRRTHYTSPTSRTAYSASSARVDPPPGPWVRHRGATVRGTLPGGTCGRAPSHLRGPRQAAFVWPSRRTVLQRR